jgi:type III pantothenate kinase
MKPAVVADVGNTLIKWGRCADGVVTETCSLPPHDPAEWNRQAELWQLPTPSAWAVAGVHPARRERLAEWALARGHIVTLLLRADQLPLQVALEHPDRVGIDRLLDAVAANARRREGVPAVIIDAGSAVTVDYLDAGGVFVGGAILPGLRLMARSLHDYTALLPEIDVPRQPPSLPGTNTVAAMEAGVFWTAVGGIKALCDQYATRGPAPPDVFLTGGDGAILYPALGAGVQLWSAMTLEGIRLAAEAMP